MERTEKIEITEEMVEAGVGAFFRGNFYAPDGLEYRRDIEDMIKSVLQACLPLTGLKSLSP